MKRILVICGVLCLLMGCRYFVRIEYRIPFYNNSDGKIYVIVDTDPQDNMISLGSASCNSVIYGRSEGYMSYSKHNRSWSELIKDSIHVYVIDASLIHLPCEIISEENLNKITPEMILKQITVFHEDVLDTRFSLSYP